MKKVVIIITAVVFFVLGIRMTAKASSKEEFRIGQEQYGMIENEYLEEVRDILLEKGCKNAGVTLRYIIDMEENRSYMVTIHHARLEDMEEWELALLEARIVEVWQNYTVGKIGILSKINVEKL